MKSNIYIISGLSPGEGGTGQFLKQLISELDQFFIVKILNRKEYCFLNKLKNENQYIIKIFYRTVLEFFSLCLILKLLFKKDPIIIIHPQTLGFFASSVLIRFKKHIYYYVMDNSFFCIRSYNYIDSEYKACLHCIHNNREAIKKNSCFPFPVEYPTCINLFFLNVLYKSQKKITFFCQNKKQKELLDNHFPDSTSVIIGMLTDDMHMNNETTNELCNSFRVYDVVFHGFGLPAKGIELLFDIAEKLPEYSFLVPDIPNINTISRSKRKFNNIMFIRTTWDTGLKTIIEHAKIVMVLSLWSAPVEGSFIKSMMYNGAVCVTDPEFSFYRELDPNDVIILHLDDWLLDIPKIKQLLENERDLNKLKVRGKNWAQRYINSQKIGGKIFEYIKLENKLNDK